jgi:hypothetical protein
LAPTEWSGVQDFKIGDHVKGRKGTWAFEGEVHRLGRACHIRPIAQEAAVADHANVADVANVDTAIRERVPFIKLKVERKRG